MDSDGVYLYKNRQGTGLDKLTPCPLQYSRAETNRRSNKTQEMQCNCVTKASSACERLDCNKKYPGREVLSPSASSHIDHNGHEPTRAVDLSSNRGCVTTSYMVALRVDMAP